MLRQAEAITEEDSPEVHSRQGIAGALFHLRTSMEEIHHILRYQLSKRNAAVKEARRLTRLLNLPDIEDVPRCYSEERELCESIKNGEWKEDIPAAEDGFISA